MKPEYEVLEIIYFDYGTEFYLDGELHIATPNNKRNYDLENLLELLKNKGALNVGEITIDENKEDLCWII